MSSICLLPATCCSHLAVVLPRHCQDLSPEDYTYRLSEAEVAELIAATDAILARGVREEEDIKKVRWQRHDGLVLACCCWLAAAQLG